MRSKLKIFNMPIRKALCFALILLLSLSTYATAAATAPSCKNGPCMQGNLAPDHVSVATKSTAMPLNCCSGAQGPTCDLEKGLNFDIPDVVISPIRLDSPDSPFFEAVAIDSFTDNPTHRGFGPHFQYRAPPLSVPIYLYNLALLC